MNSKIYHVLYFQKEILPSKLVFAMSVLARPVEFLGGDSIICGRGSERSD